MTGFLILIITLFGSGLTDTISCYQCRRETLLNPESPKSYAYYNLDYDDLDSSCLEKPQPCEEDDEYGMFNCTSVTMGPDHSIADGVESVEVFFCMHFDINATEDEAETEICFHEGAEEGPDCNVTANCGEDGCNYPTSTTPPPHVCSTCKLPISDICDQDSSHTESCELVNCTAGVSQCFTKVDSCNITYGCKTPEITDCEENSNECSVCEDEECALDTTLLCKPGGECIEEPPHVCSTCTYQACGDVADDTCQDFQDCPSGVRECYSQFDSCEITRGCKTPDLTCEKGSKTCSVCGDKECNLDSETLCKEAGNCAVVCNVCVIDLAEFDSCSTDDNEWKDFAEQNCDKRETCKSDVQECAIITDKCTATVGCNEKQAKGSGPLTFVSFLDLINVLTTTYKERYSIIEDCPVFSKTRSAEDCASTSTITDNTNGTTTSNSISMSICIWLFVFLNFVCCTTYLY